MKIRLFLDEDVHAGLAHALRQRGYDVVYAQELELKGRRDSEQLESASNQRRCLVSFNVKDFVILHNQYVESSKNHNGIILSKQLPFKETMKRLLEPIQLLDSESIKNRLKFL